MLRNTTKWKLCEICGKRGLRTGSGSALLSAFLLASSICSGFLSASAWAQQANTGTPVVVQPGAPGQPSKKLPASTRATLPRPSHAEIEFMQGMIVHHLQAVEMTALIASHTANKNLQSLGARISSSQSDEIQFMQRWLTGWGEPISMPMSGMQGMHMSGSAMTLMPGMLTPEQMDALRNAKGAKFDQLFLSGMIQHHNGALNMVKDLFNTAGAGQNADVFDFATDADNTQRAEIRIMQSMLDKKSSKEKQ
jgi:uncharacterized protein (DUF305 family)